MVKPHCRILHCNKFQAAQSAAAPLVKSSGHAELLMTACRGERPEQQPTSFMSRGSKQTSMIYMLGSARLEPHPVGLACTSGSACTGAQWHLCNAGAQETDSSRHHMHAHLEGCISALLHAFPAQSRRPKAEPGGSGVHRGSPRPKNCFCPVHWPWAQVAGTVPGALQARPKLPGGGITKGVGNAAALFLPVVSTVSSGEQPLACSVIKVMIVAALHSCQWGVTPSTKDSMSCHQQKLVNNKSQVRANAEATLLLTLCEIKLSDVGLSACLEFAVGHV